MKTLIQTSLARVKHFSFLTLMLMAILAIPACQQQNGALAPEEAGTNNSLSQITLLPVEPLSPAEEANLLYMREEEKLAHDVYTALYDQWNVAIFQNIAQSEQKHMDAIFALLQKYSLIDPAIPTAGVFTNPDLQALYSTLIAQGSQSLIAALQVGATIEDVDIRDLNVALQDVDNQDITLVMENLRKGSRNHLRSFYSTLVANGASYSPQFISQAEFDVIINSAMETGGNKQGNGKGRKGK